MGFSLRENSLSYTHTVCAFSLCGLCFIYKVCLKKKKKKQLLMSKEEEQRAEVAVLIRGVARENKPRGQLPSPPPPQPLGVRNTKKPAQIRRPEKEEQAINSGGADGGGGRNLGKEHIFKDQDPKQGPRPGKASSVRGNTELPSQVGQSARSLGQGQPCSQHLRSSVCLMREAVLLSSA